MTDNPYAPPESCVKRSPEQPVLNGNIFWVSGRLSVISFLAHYALVFCVDSAVSAALTMLTGSSPETLALTSDSSSISVLAFYLSLVSSMLFGWIGVCLIVKRLHDLNLSGWWMLLGLWPPFAIGALSYWGYDGGPWVMVLVVVMISAFLFVPGKPIPNQFGGWRETRLWEKVVLGLLALVAIVAVLIAYFGFADSFS